MGNLLERGENLDVLIEKSHDLSAESKLLWSRV
jgi:hypothetical protein